MDEIGHDNIRNRSSRERGERKSLPIPKKNPIFLSPRFFHLHVKSMTKDGCTYQLENDDEEEFFDSREEISSIFESCPGSPCTRDSIADESVYSVWLSSPDSVRARRARFMSRMGLDTCSDPIDPDIMPTTSSDDAPATCSTSCPCTSGDSVSGDGFELEINDNMGSFTREAESNRSLFDTNFSKRRDRERDKASNVKRAGRSKKIGWLRKLGGVACVVDRQEEESDLDTANSDKSTSSRARRVKVHRCNKRSKEFSAVYTDQDIDAHNGAILTMRFSPDGEFLASGGEDGVVRIWRVTECERRDEDELLEYDPSCIYFKVNRNSELAPVYAVDKEKIKSRSMKKTPDSACVVIPSEVFRISETPLHEFHGHDGDVLDLSWSSDKYLLSSSTDKTVRLWKVGCDHCLNVFVHNNYVTSVQFNPTNENYFVSGSIDGKIRIWELSRSRVVDWTDIRDIVTAVCYHPDGKRIVVGTMTGDCRFYDVSDNVLELEVQISLQGKKKSPDKRITGFQYCPGNHRKLMVTSADSLVRILDGVDIVSKYKGLRNAGTRISASFTSDGRHIVSASADSNVCMWAHDSNNSSVTDRVKTTKSCEQFVSSHLSVAIPWHGQASRSVEENCADSSNGNTVYLSPAGSFTLSSELFSEYVPKGSLTWPEEKLPAISACTAATLRKSQYKFLKASCRNSSHAWGQVIVTGGWDGRIRSYQNHGLPVNH